MKKNNLLLILVLLLTGVSRGFAQDIWTISSSTSIIGNQVFDSALVEGFPSSSHSGSICFRTPFKPTK